MYEGMKALRKNLDKLVTILHIMQDDVKLPCFEKKFSLDAFKNRFKVHYSDEKLRKYVNSLISQSNGNHRT